MESAAMTRMREARTGLLLTHPFFGVLSPKLELIEDSAIPTMGVNTRALKFNPAFVMSLSNAELKGVTAHEVMHLALLHHARQGTRDASMWNDAGDYAINQNLLSDGFTLPDGALVDPQYQGKSAEQIYTLLRDKQAQEQPQQSPQANKPGAGNQPGNGAPTSSGTGQGTPAPAAPNPCGTFEAAGPEGSSEATEAARDWQENANQAIRAASSAGKMPAGIKRVVSEAIVAKADWRALLRRFMNDQVKTRATWSTPNKRFPDIYLPGKVRDGMGALVVAVDTSGSISAAVLNRFASEINAIAEDVEPSAIHVVYCDAAVNRVDVFEHGEPVVLKACGGGGTRFSPVFSHVDTAGLAPAALVYLTDLRCSDYPRHEPAYPVLWASYNARGAVAPFGETVAID